MRSFLYLLLSTIVAANDISDFDSQYWNYALCTNLSVQADQPFVVKTINNITQNAQFGWNALRVTIARSSNNSDGVLNPVCTLIDCLPWDSPNIIATIPSYAGPSGRYYDISASMFNTQNLNVSQPYRTNDSSLFYTNGWNGFNLTGGKSDFYPWEISPREEDFDHDWPWSLQIFPCAAYGCARSCINQNWDQLVSNPDDYTQVISCIMDCPGVNTTTNYCPDVGGTTQPIPSSIDVNSVPDGCAKFDPSAFPKAAASASAASAASMSAAQASSTSGTTTGARSSSSSTSAGSVVESLSATSVFTVLALVFMLC